MKESRFIKKWLDNYVEQEIDEMRDDLDSVCENQNREMKKDLDMNEQPFRPLSDLIKPTHFEWELNDKDQKLIKTYLEWVNQHFYVNLPKHWYNGETVISDINSIPYCVIKKLIEWNFIID